MEQLDSQCEKFIGGPTLAYSERVHVTINRRGTIFLNQKALRMIGDPPAVYLYFNRPKNMIIIEPTAAATSTAAFHIRQSGPTTGRYIYANPFCKNFRIRVAATEKFVDPSVDSVGRLYLKLNETITVANGPRGKRRKSRNPER
jgi:hypothetical protein